MRNVTRECCITIILNVWSTMTLVPVEVFQVFTSELVLTAPELAYHSTAVVKVNFAVGSTRR